MEAISKPVDIPVDQERIAGTFLAPEAKMPGVLFVHGWGGSQEADLVRARGVAGLGCICLTFDLRGHAKTEDQKSTVTREHNLQDLLAAYDLLAAHPGLDPSSIVVIGSSYGAYLATILTTLRPVKWLALQVPALYRDTQWDTPKGLLDKKDLATYRRTHIKPTENRALGACAGFEGDVLIVESEHDEIIPHPTIMSYRAAFMRSHSLTHRIIDGADHALSTKTCQQAYTSILISWVTEMVVGARMGGPEPGEVKPF